jgi:hypothetical protein
MEVMAGKNRPSISKRQKELKRAEKRQKKEERKQLRQSEKDETRTETTDGVDPDIAHIVAGPQPILED